MMEVGGLEVETDHSSTEELCHVVSGEGEILLEQVTVCHPKIIAKTVTSLVPYEIQENSAKVQVKK